MQEVLPNITKNFQLAKVLEEHDTVLGTDYLWGREQKHPSPGYICVTAQPIIAY